MNFDNLLTFFRSECFCCFKKWLKMHFREIVYSTDPYYFCLIFWVYFPKENKAYVIMYSFASRAFLVLVLKSVISKKNISCKTMTMKLWITFLSSICFLVLIIFFQDKIVKEHTKISFLLSKNSVRKLISNGIHLYIAIAYYFFVTFAAAALILRTS